jgi:urea carboxylase
MTVRYSWGGDEHLFIEVAEAMSLDAFFIALSMSRTISEKAIPGVTEVCPANASLQVRFDPDVISGDTLLARVRLLEQDAARVIPVLDTRVIEIPVLYNDPWTHETLMRFRERHQEPGSTDLEYAARMNRFDGPDSFIDAHAGMPWFVTMVGFVAGLPFLYQMVGQDRQIEVPKYLRPRTDTPRLTVGHGGCFGCIYSVRGAGGYQMFGVTPMPIYDPTQQVTYLREFMILFRSGDIVKFRPVTREEYDRIVRDVDAGRYVPVIRPATFDLGAFRADPSRATAALLEALP